MPIEREILNMFEFSRNSKIAIAFDSHFDEDTSQIDKAFRCIDTYNRKTSTALWVHPFSLHSLTYSWRGGSQSTECPEVGVSGGGVS